MRNYQDEFEKRVAYIRAKVREAHADGIVFGNSGGKDSALVGILCKTACSNTLGVIMPCASRRNYGQDRDDGNALASQYGIETRIVDLTAVREAELKALEGVASLSDMAVANIAPRLRMTTLYTIGQSENRLVAGTGNRSEIYMGYFTKWGDGASDFNPIADLCAGEVFEFLRFLNAPASIVEKAPSAGLYEGQTDEKEMGVTYRAIDAFLLQAEVNAADKAVIDRYHSRSEHKRRIISTFENP